MPRDGTSWSVFWPLKMIFVTTFLASMIGLVWFRSRSGDEWIDWILLGVSIGVALVMLFPTFACSVRFFALVRRGHVAKSHSKQSWWCTIGSRGDPAPSTRGLGTRSLVICLTARD